MEKFNKSHIVLTKEETEVSVSNWSPLLKDGLRKLKKELWRLVNKARKLIKKYEGERRSGEDGRNEG